MGGASEQVSLEMIPGTSSIESCSHLVDWTDPLWGSLPDVRLWFKLKKRWIKCWSISAGEQRRLRWDMIQKQANIVGKIKAELKLIILTMQKMSMQ